MVFPCLPISAIYVLPFFMLSYFFIAAITSGFCHFNLLFQVQSSTARRQGTAADSTNWLNRLQTFLQAWSAKANMGEI